MQEAVGVSERRVCRVLNQPRSTQRYQALVADDEARLRARIVALAGEYRRYGYRRITALLQAEGWAVNHKRIVKRHQKLTLWRHEN